MNSRGPFLAVLFIAVASAGCGQNRTQSAGAASIPAKEQAAPGPDFEGIYDAATAVFQKATYCKPIVRTEADDRQSVMAPLILIEWRPISASAPTPRPQSRPEAVNWSLSTVYHTETAAKIHGADFAQRIDLWLENSAPSNLTWRWQGIRTTFGADGFPLCYEVVPGAVGRPQVLFVTEPLELAARREFGPPLAGRRYSIEAAPGRNPSVVVARVISDGPQPMGPWVYIRQSDREISSVLCRCMPSQVREVVESPYRLVPLDLVEMESPHSLDDSRPRSLAELDWPKIEMTDPSWLEGGLRWPARLPGDAAGRWTP